LNELILIGCILVSGRTAGLLWKRCVLAYSHTRLLFHIRAWWPTW